MLRKIYLLFLTVLAALPALAQNGSGSIKGKLTDKASGEPVPFANVIAKRNGVVVSGAQTDFDGNFFIKPLDPGKYDVEASFTGYATVIKAGLNVNGDEITFQNIQMSTSANLKEVIIETVKDPVIHKDGGNQQVVGRDQILKMAGRSGESVAKTLGGVSTAGTGGGISIRGSRADGGNFIYIDGVKVRGSSNLPKASLNSVTVITGGVPANYGDLTSGVISYTTRGPSATFTGSLEAQSSGFRSGNGAKGLDPFGFNLVEGYLTGPIWSKIDAEGQKDPIIGFSASLNYTDQVDGNPSSVGWYQITDAERARLYSDLLATNAGGQVVTPRAQDLRRSSFENIKTSPNTSSQTVNGTFKFDVKTAPTINLTFGGSFNFNKNRSFDGNNALMNANNNRDQQNLDWRTYGKFTQRFKSSAESASAIKNVYYSVLVDYSKTQGQVQNAFHKKNFFDYGYVGKFDILRGPAPYDTLYDEGGNPVFLIQSDLPKDTLVKFTASDKNPELAMYTTEYFKMFDKIEGNYDRLASIQNKGLRNGDAPMRVYDLFNAPGTPYGTYQKSDNSQFRVSANGSADIGNHAVQAGFEYEQRSDRTFGYNNLVAEDRQNNVWAIARNLTNFHLKGLDHSDSTITYQDAEGNDLLYPIISYNVLRNPETQTAFDMNLRKSLGLDPNGRDLINLDALNPELLSMDFFSADELINSGNSLVTYWGYDTKGNKLKNRPSFDDYFTEKDEYGQFANKIGAFEPIYFAGYVMDKFTFDDIIFNVGLRVDRYDANQKVLKDKFLFKEAKNLGDLKAEQSALISGNGFVAPANIGDDYTVYVDDSNNPKSIIGYRSGSQFYNAQGKVAAAKAVKNSSGVIAPALKNPNAVGRGAIQAGAFKDYDPQVNFMPRIAFSFPISEEAQFTAHYDVLTRRPVSNNRLDLIRYQYIGNINSTSTNPINNPNLKPEKTIDYEVAFQQALSKKSSLKIQLFYRENRDQMQVFQNVGAYPQDYYSIDNLDFGTVKGMTLTYDLKQTGNLTFRTNYTLQFADGTGSALGGVVNLNATDFSTLRTIAPLNFDQRHKVNAVIDYSYGVGQDYNGPKIGKTKILQGVGANFVVDLGSGTPYSGSSDPNSNRLRGTINGSRLPWRFTCDFNLVKEIPVTFKKETEAAAAKKGNVNITLTVNNLFNTKNITGVYANTGNPEDDGYLADPRYQTVIANKQNPASFRDLYTLDKFNPGNYSAPRTVRLGVRLDF